jgi:molecular chaperone DnaJ
VTATNELPRDYYAVLQVSPEADREVIDAAYRQLMKKHHPDMAGNDPRRIAEHLARARVLNEAHAVLGDPEQRRRYDRARRAYGWESPPASAPGRGAPPPPGAASQPPAPPGPAPSAEPSQSVGSVIVHPPTSSLPGPFGLISAAYYLLPGPYEWEEGSRRELLTVGLLPVVGMAVFLLLTGRLAPWIGHSLNGTVVAWGLIALLCLPMLGALPRVVIAGGPSLLLLGGNAAPILQQMHLPVWFAWGVASLVSVMLAARLFVFAVLPTVAACWLVARLT